MDFENVAANITATDTAMSGIGSDTLSGLEALQITQIGPAGGR